MPKQIASYAQLIHTYDLTGRDNQKMFYEFLELCTTLPVAKLKQLFSIPCYTTAIQAYKTLAVAKLQQLRLSIGSSLVSIEHDEGSHHRRHYHVTLVVYTLPSGQVYRSYMGAPMVNSTSAQESVDTINKLLSKLGVGVYQVIWDVGDSAAANIKAVQLASENKKKVMLSMLEDGALSRPALTTVPLDILEFFCVIDQHPRVLLPWIMYRIADMVHIFKNAEGAGLKAVGGGIHPLTGLHWADVRHARS